MRCPRTQLPLLCAAYNAARGELYSAGQDPVISVWAAAGGALLRRQPGHRGRGTRAACTGAIQCDRTRETSGLTKCATPPLWSNYSRPRYWLLPDRRALGSANAALPVNTACATRWWMLALLQIEAQRCRWVLDLLFEASVRLLFSAATDRTVAVWSERGQQLQVPPPGSPICLPQLYMVG